MLPELRAKRDAFLDRIGTRPLIMGILNVTPDSFSDGGCFVAADAALAHTQEMLAAGCDIVDVGAESTRPGATSVTDAEELARLEPILTVLADVDAPLSVDTSKAAVAARAAALGAVMINDVWGLQHDMRMAETVAEAETAVVIMHSRTEKDERLDIIADVRRFFDRSLALAARAGVLPGRIVLDPGIGFGKTSLQNRDCIARLSELKDYGLPILVGSSRKRFLGSLTGDGSEGTLVGTVTVSLAAIAAGASIVRVHDVTEHVTALKVFQALRTHKTR
ncbi:MAG TPA: dihydropteroate synthase [Pseudolabrys sp.]